MLVDYMGERGIDNLDMRFTNLGHIQRGGSPTAFDRILASKMGITAVRKLLKGERNCMLGLQKNEVVSVPLDEIKKGKQDRIIKLHREYIEHEIMMTKKLTPPS